MNQRRRRQAKQRRADRLVLSEWQDQPWMAAGEGAIDIERMFRRWRQRCVRRRDALRRAGGA